MHDTHDDERIGLVVVGFSPVDRLDAIAGHLSWAGLVLSDPTRQLYRRLGTGGGCTRRAPSSSTDAPSPAVIT
ncbi:MAG TPA: hypothetical protein VNC61_01665 [Acidimicrobiales bacterium]|nr:hypothetical protein [Acidimicrobiales bacterium]